MLHNHSWSSHANSEASWEYDQLSYSLYSLCDIISVRALRLYLFLYLFLHVYHMTPIVKRTLLPWGLLVALAGNITNRGESWKKCGWCLHWLYACFYPNAPYISILQTLIYITVTRNQWHFQHKSSLFARAFSLQRESYNPLFPCFPSYIRTAMTATVDWTS